jgi:hypothetical protein
MYSTRTAFPAFSTSSAGSLLRHPINKVFAYPLNLMISIQNIIAASIGLVSI